MKSMLEQAQMLTQERVKDLGVHIVSVWWQDDSEDCILIDVDDTFDFDCGADVEVLPFRFSADPEFGTDYPTVQVTLTPHEWKVVQNGTVALPGKLDKSKWVCLHERTNETIKDHWLDQMIDAAKEARKAGADDGELFQCLEVAVIGLAPMKEGEQ